MSNEFSIFLNEIINDKPIREREGIEFKPSLSWNIGTVQVQKIMKTILALSNRSGGGKIVLGIAQDDRTREFIDTGMRDDDFNSFADTDRVYQDASNYGEPAPIVETIRTEFNNKKYIIIIVQEFNSSPVICKKDLGRQEKILEKGCLYIRTSKPESKKVEHENEMRRIIDLAIKKEIIKFSERISLLKFSKINLNPTEDDAKKFEEEVKEFK